MSLTTEVVYLLALVMVMTSAHKNAVPGTNGGKLNQGHHASGSAQVPGKLTTQTKEMLKKVRENVERHKQAAEDNAVEYSPHMHRGSQHLHIRESGLENFKDRPDNLNVLHNQEFVKNKEHLKAHMQDDLDIDLEGLTDEELEFHFFNVHDNDKNRALDGLELLEAVMHGLEEQFEDIEDDEELSVEEKEDETDYLYDKAYRTIDNLLITDDRDKDGYISISEYIHSRRIGKVLLTAHEDLLP